MERIRITVPKQHADRYETVVCNLCGSEHFTVKYKPTVQDFDPERIFSASGGLRGTQYIVQCKQCGLMYVNPRVKSDVVIGAYTETPDDLYLTQVAARSKTFRSCLKVVERHATKKGRILDVGAAGGIFLKVASEKGWEPYGVEPSKWLCAFAKQHFDIDQFQGTLCEAAYPDNYFDVVTLWDVLEHVPDPAADLREIFRVLKPEGVLVVNYPDAGTLQAKLAGGKWWFFLSVHLYYFTRKTIQAMLHKVGFEPISTKRHFQVLGLGHLVKMVGLYSKSISYLASKVVSAIRLDDLGIPYYAGQTNVIARKPL